MSLEKLAPFRKQMEKLGIKIGTPGAYSGDQGGVTVAKADKRKKKVSYSVKNISPKRAKKRDILKKLVAKASKGGKYQKIKPYKAIKSKMMFKAPKMPKMKRS